MPCSFTVTIKYVLFLMRADNKGEGGTLSLMALAQHALGRRGGPVFLLGVAGAALFSGDAIITPAISVLSAVEGLGVAESELQPYVIPITVAILITLFVVQRGGTARVATLLRPDHGRVLLHHRPARPRAHHRRAADPHGVQPAERIWSSCSATA